MNRTVVIPRGARLTGSRWESLVCRLPAREQQRVAAFTHWENQQDSVLGWLLLAELAGSDQLVRDGRGRPRAEPPLDVSLSHSGGWIAAASSAQGRIGIDVEAERDISPGLAEYCLAPAEHAWLERARPQAAQRERFFRLWTAKEAYLKATGEGILADLRRVAIDHSAGPARVVGDEQGRWRFTVTSPAPQVWVTVCQEQR